MLSFEGASYGSLDAFGLVRQNVPAPLAGQVRIRVDTTALGFVDGLIVQGRYQIKPPLPYVPGGEIVGVVDAIGAGVRHPPVGSRVVTWQLGGGLSEYLIVAANELELIPAGLDYASAAAMLVDYPTAQYALFERPRKPGPVRRCWSWARLAASVRRPCNLPQRPERTSSLRPRQRRNATAPAYSAPERRSTPRAKTYGLKSGRTRLGASWMSWLTRLAALTLSRCSDHSLKNLVI